MGDRVLVYFGYPQAHEDDAERRACWSGVGRRYPRPEDPRALADPRRHRNGPSGRWRPDSSQDR
jgi:class 3 adenylate cyclase